MNHFLLLAVCLVWLFLVIILHQKRIWIFYYLLGTIGLSTLLVLVNRNLLHSEILLAQSVAESIHYLTGLLRIPTQIFEEAPGLLLVMVVVQRVGWTALQIGVESSALLEISVLLGLIAFYPGWQLKDRLWRALAGIALTWLANLLRMLMIVLMLHFLGKEVLVLAHTLLGKLIFFFCTIAIYWYLITAPSLKLIRSNILNRSTSQRTG
jgi:exosortase family protein XrtG